MQAESEPDQFPTRKTLVRKLGDLGDQESWREFFETYWRLIYNFALKSGCSESEAEEVVQETVISVSRKMPEFKYDPAVCSFKGWLMHVANWRVIDQLRKRNHRLVSIHGGDSAMGSESFDQIPDPMAGETERLWQQEWDDNLVTAALDRVKRQCNPEHYQIYFLLVLRQKSVTEVANSLHVTRATIYVAKHRVAALVRREVKRLETKLLDV